VALIAFEISKVTYITTKRPQSEKYYSITQKYRKVATSKLNKKSG